MLLSARDSFSCVRVETIESRQSLSPLFPPAPLPATIAYRRKGPDPKSDVHDRPPVLFTDRATWTDNSCTPRARLLLLLLLLPLVSCRRVLPWNQSRVHAKRIELNIALWGGEGTAWLDACTHVDAFYTVKTYRVTWNHRGWTLFLVGGSTLSDRTTDWQRSTGIADPVARLLACFFHSRNNFLLSFFSTDSCDFGKRRFVGLLGQKRAITLSWNRYCY